jgi:hypothetical protein
MLVSKQPIIGLCKITNVHTNNYLYNTVEDDVFILKGYYVHLNEKWINGVNTGEKKRL